MNEKHIEENKLIITRIFDAPRDLVFKMWTDSEHLKHWWGPKGLTMHIAKLDLCSDGVFHYSMKSPDGQEMWGSLFIVKLVHRINLYSSILFLMRKVIQSVPHLAQRGLLKSKYIDILWRRRKNKINYARNPCICDRRGIRNFPGSAWWS